MNAQVVIERKKFKMEKRDWLTFAIVLALVSAAYCALALAGVFPDAWNIFKIGGGGILPPSAPVGTSVVCPDPPTENQWFHFYWKSVGGKWLVDTGTSEDPLLPPWQKDKTPICVERDIYEAYLLMVDSSIDMTGLEYLVASYAQFNESQEEALRAAFVDIKPYESDGVEYPELGWIVLPPNGAEAPYQPDPTPAATRAAVPPFGTATPVRTNTPIMTPPEDEAFLKYAEIVGQEVALAAWVPHDHCFATLNASWEDVSGNTQLTEVIHILSPSGFIIKAETGGYGMIGLTTDQMGYYGCVNISSLPSTFGSGTWHMEQYGTVHWTESYPGDATEILVGNAWIWPVYSDVLPTSTPPPVPVLGLSALGDWMEDQGFQTLYTPNCPPEPLQGQVTLTTLGSTTARAVVDFRNDASAGMRYSQVGCTSAGGLYFYTADPGHGSTDPTRIEQVQYGSSLWVWPLNKAIVVYMPTRTPGGPVIPPTGSEVTLHEALDILAALGRNTAGVQCTNYTDGAIWGWPNEVQMTLSVGLVYTVDFSAVASQVDTSALCHGYFDNDKWVMARGISLYRTQPLSLDIASAGPFISYEGWYLGPFK